MKGNLRSACLLFFVFLFFIVGFVGLVNANKNPNNASSSSSPTVGRIESPTIAYNTAYGYTGQSYNFTVKDDVLSEDYPIDAKMIFYWDTSNNRSDYNYFQLNDALDATHSTWTHAHIWNKPGIYYISVGIAESKGERLIIKKSSPWIPIYIREDPKVQSFFMLDEKNGFDGNATNHIYDSNVLSLSNNSGDNCEKKYCAYAKNVYAFSAILNSTNPVNRKGNDIGEEIKAVFEWDDRSYDVSSRSDDNISDISDENITSYDVGGTKYIHFTKVYNYTHEWGVTGEKNISVKAAHWDPLSQSEEYSNYCNKSVLIIRNPQNFWQSPNSIINFFSNLQNLGVVLIAAGLMILFFTFTKNVVPVKIALFGIKPFYLKSVDSFIGIFSFVTGMYLYFVFGRCPWDIPIISISQRLQDAYFSMLYYEYKSHTIPGDNTNNAIPFLSILLCLIVVFSLSVFVYHIGIPFLKGESKSGKFFREILRRERSLLPRPSTQRFSIQLKGFFILLKEKIWGIDQNARKGDKFSCNPRRKEEY